ncbi:WD40 repeat domain-containing protein [Streptomyces sp. SB3404]|uniref:WD40 repeat domain-containing protein n=1 Tax=Streptomyces boncukensis TaxID=2711219 RepID=A0A6G4XA11_9ACTN|nr:WD40 repeat domain-containing protein [Streptomyces boncukensis]
MALGDGTEDTRRPLPRAELDRDADTAHVLEQAAHLRLITLDQDRVQLTHEAVIQAWPRLRGWLAEDRDRLRVQRRLTEDARAWEDVGRDSGALYRGERLALARELLADPQVGLTTGERAFLRASTAVEAAARRSARRRTLVWRSLVFLLATLLVATAVATDRASRARHQLAQQRDRAAARDLAETATDLYPTRPGLAVQLGLAAYRLDRTPTTRDSLLSTLATSWDAHPDGEVSWLDFGPEGKLLATGGSDHVARLWETHGLARPDAVATLSGHGGAVRSVAFSADGRTLATGGDDRRVRLWRVADPRRPARTATLSGHRGAVRSVAFSPDGRTLATASNDRTVRLWNIADPRNPTTTATLTGHSTMVFAVAFSPDGRTLATAGGGDTPVLLWDLSGTGKPARRAVLRGHRDVVGAVDFSPDGRRLATASDDRTVQLWDVSDPGRPTTTATLSGYTTAVGSVAFSPDGRVLAASSYIRSVHFYGLDPDRAIGRACEHARPTITRDQWSAHVPYLDYAPPCGTPGA